MDRVLTVQQAADYLQVTPYTIRKWLRRGRIPARKIGRLYRILESDLGDLLGRSSPEGSEVEFEAEQVEPQTEWQALSRQEKERRADSVIGKYARPGRTLDDFMREKHEEVEEEERRWEKRHSK